MTGFQRAQRKAIKGRVALVGPSGAGKTWTMLEWLTALAGGGPIAVVDTENRSSELYADTYGFDVRHWNPPYDPRNLAVAVREAEAAGYAALGVDSVSHFWEGEGGTLDIKNAAAEKVRGNDFAGWKEASPAFRELIDAIRLVNMHVVCTFRTKTDYVLETDERGKTKPRRVGLAPVSRAGIEYEFTVVGDMDLEHRMEFSKTRCALLDGRAFPKGKSGEAADLFARWLDSGVAPATAEQLAAIRAHFAGIENEQARRQAKATFVSAWGALEHLTEKDAAVALAELVGGAS